MFSVIFEVHPRPKQLDNYFGQAKMLRPDLENIDGFVDNIRYRSLTREGWILSVSSWRDEKAVVRWRTQMRHHAAQERGRSETFLDYHLRVGQLTKDTNIPQSCELREQRLDETEVGEGTTLILIDGKRTADWVKSTSAEEVAGSLGRASKGPAPVSWDVFDAVLTPGDILLLMSWHNQIEAEAFEKTCTLQEGVRFRRIRVVRDYGMYDRREAPQYFPDVL